MIPFVDARYPTLAAREHRGVSGKSSGGYGAMVISMLRPEVFGALASHAGDALFGHKGTEEKVELASGSPARLIVVDLKDHPAPPPVNVPPYW